MRKRGLETNTIPARVLPPGKSARSCGAVAEPQVFSFQPLLAIKWQDPPLDREEWRILPLLSVGECGGGNRRCITTALTIAHKLKS